MERRSFLKTVGTAGLAATVTPAWSMDDVANRQSSASGSSGVETALRQASPETILLKDYRPRSLYKLPVTNVPKAKFPIIDMHSHPYARTSEEIAEWVRNMDESELRRPSFFREPRDRSLTIFIGSTLSTPIVSNSGAALITRGMTNQDSASEQSRRWRSAIRQAHVGLANFMIRAKASIRTR
jgi:hypothetical protein